MRGALIRALLLGLVRDRGALLLTFLLPPAVFVIFALIFSRTSGTDLEIRFAVADARADAVSERLIEGLTEGNRLQRVGAVEAERAVIEPLVRSGEVDAGIVIEAAETGSPLPSLTVLKAPSREIAATVLAAAARQSLLSLQDEAAGGLPPLPIEVEELTGRAVPVAVAYYAAGVAMLFVLIAAVQGAAHLLSDRESGMLARLAHGPGRLGPVLDATFLFLVLQGVVQIVIIFAVAWAGFGVSLAGVWAPWALTTLLAAMVASGLALAFVSLCSTKRQADAFGPIGVLVLGAIGGSMVPRFLMPQSIQAVGWLTPNTWGLEAYAALLWRDEPLQSLYLPWGILAGVSVVALLISRIVSRRWI